MKSAYNSLADFINSLDKDCFQEQSVESEEHDHEDNRDELHPTQHPFGAYFSKKKWTTLHYLTKEVFTMSTTIQSTLIC